MDPVEGHPVAVPAWSGAESAPAMASPLSPAQAQAATIAANLVQPTLFSYIANDLVWARAGNKGNEPFWPVRPRLNPSHPRAFESTLPRTARGSPVPSSPRAARPPSLRVPPDDSRTLPSFPTRRAA